jgi:hypothetical protein
MTPKFPLHTKQSQAHSEESVGVTLDFCLPISENSICCYSQISEIVLHLS